VFGSIGFYVPVPSVAFGKLRHPWAAVHISLRGTPKCAQNAQACHRRCRFIGATDAHKWFAGQQAFAGTAPCIRGCPAATTTASAACVLEVARETRIIHLTLTLFWLNYITIKDLSWMLGGVLKLHCAGTLRGGAGATWCCKPTNECRRMKTCPCRPMTLATGDASRPFTGNWAARKPRSAHQLWEWHTLSLHRGGVLAADSCPCDRMFRPSLQPNALPTPSVHGYPVTSPPVMMKSVVCGRPLAAGLTLRHGTAPLARVNNLGRASDHPPTSSNGRLGWSRCQRCSLSLLPSGRHGAGSHAAAAQAGAARAAATARHAHRSRHQGATCSLAATTT